MAKVKLPAGPAELTTDWLTNALRETGTITEAAVTGLDYKIIGEGEGVLGQLARFRLQFDKPEGGAPATLVGKFPASVQANRDFANLFRFYEREVRFYEEIADEVELRTPKRYYSHFDPETNDYILLMEDMGAALCGNQVAGCPAENAITVLRNMARFHATWWEHPRLESLDWIPYGNHPIHQSAQQAYQDCWDNFLKNFGDRLSARALTAAERLSTRIIDLQNAITKPPMSIAHGDLRYDNLYFNADEMAVADWQIVLRGRASYDAAYFMSQSVDPAVRKSCEMEALRTYHETLREGGVSGYSFDDLMWDYRSTAMYCLVYPVISGGTLDLANERGTALVTAMLDRSIATILDLDCDEMIPA
jgi:thiamine kinase-like enzyme